MSPALEDLAYGVCSRAGQEPRVCVRVGHSALDLATALDDPVFDAPSLNGFLARGRPFWTDVRARVTRLLDEGRDMALVPLQELRLHLPVEVGDYVDFYASEHHAANVGRMFRPDSDPLTPNWRHMPIGYHGRAGSIVVSGTPVRRPSGQRLVDGTPTFGPSKRLDFEAELGFVVGAGSTLGRPVPAAAFADHVFGVCLVNDWSARDIQAWEYRPLGPFLGKSFATSISPWIIPLDALDHAWLAPPAQEPRPLPYLAEPPTLGLDVSFEVRINGHVVSKPPYSSMYWTPAQMLAHLTVNGAPVRPGDLYASGTVSGPAPDQLGSLIELSWNGRDPLTLADGGRRTFLEDGDEVTISASAPGPHGTRIDLGSVTGRVDPAH